MNRLNGGEFGNRIGYFSFTQRMDSALVLAEAIDESQLRSQLLIDSPAPLLRNMRFYVS